MIERSLIHVAGPPGSGKTTFIETLLRSIDAAVLVARCVRDDTLRKPRESARKTDPELKRYRAAGASGAARFAFPQDDTTFDAFFTTDAMADYSKAVVLEGDNPLGLADLSVFVAPTPPPRGRLFVRRRRDRAKAERAKADAVERLLRQPDGVAQFLGRMVGGPAAEIGRQHPEQLEEIRATLLAGITHARQAPRPKRTTHWAVAEGYAGIEHAQLVVVNVLGEDQRERGERLVADLARLRKDDRLFTDILGPRGSKIPITAVAANFADPKDHGRRKAVTRVRRTIGRASP